MLDVEREPMEFACPGCATPQEFPPELMPPPRLRRPLPLVAVPGPARVPCRGCGVVLAVPLGLRRLLACPLCIAEIAIDGGAAGAFLLSTAASRSFRRRELSRSLPPPHGVRGEAGQGRHVVAKRDCVGSGRRAWGIDGGRR